MYRDSEFSYRDFRCDCYQSPHDGAWCVDFSHRSDGLPMVTVQRRKKADAMREATRQMDERLLSETERLKMQLAATEASRARILGALQSFVAARLEIPDGCEWNFGQLEEANERGRAAIAAEPAAPPPSTPAATPTPQA